MNGISWGPIIIIFGLICAGIGWAVIEALIWLFSHISIV